MGYMSCPFDVLSDSMAEWNYWLENPPFQHTQFSVSVEDGRCELSGGIDIVEGFQGAFKRLAATITSGDSVGIHFDFINMQTSFFHNGSCRGVMYTDIPSRVRPALIFCLGHSFTLSKWDVVWK